MELSNDEKGLHLGRNIIFPDRNLTLIFNYVLHLPTAQLQCDTFCFLGMTIKFSHLPLNFLRKCKCLKATHITNTKILYWVLLIFFAELQVLKLRIPKIAMFRIFHYCTQHWQRTDLLAIGPFLPHYIDSQLYAFYLCHQLSTMQQNGHIANAND